MKWIPWLLWRWLLSSLQLCFNSVLLPNDLLKYFLEKKNLSVWIAYLQAGGDKYINIYPLSCRCFNVSHLVLIGKRLCWKMKLARNHHKCNYTKREKGGSGPVSLETSRFWSRSHLPPTRMAGNSSLSRSNTFPILAKISCISKEDKLECEKIADGITRGEGVRDQQTSHGLWWRTWEERLYCNESLDPW